jgi:hypothetical protein
MSRKEKVSFVRTIDFESLDEELSQAMEALDDTNSRITELLETEDDDIAEAPATQEDTDKGTGEAADASGRE